MKVKSDLDPHQQELWRLKMEPEWAADAHKSRRLGTRNRAVEALKRPVVVDSHRFDDEQDPDPHQNENEGSGAKVMRIRNTDRRDAMDQDLHCFVQ